MKKHFLSEHVKGLKKKKFKPEVFYNRIGDQLEFQTENVAVVAEQLNENLIILHSEIDNKVVGFKILNVKSLIA
jgi:hypothetical protein